MRWCNSSPRNHIAKDRPPGRPSAHREPIPLRPEHYLANSRNVGASPGFREAADSLREYETDRPAGDDPNALGPVARPVSDATASRASGLCDEHDQDQLRILGSSRLQRFY